jgi:hypothetical protein
VNVSAQAREAGGKNRGRPRGRPAAAEAPRRDPLHGGCSLARRPSCPVVPTEVLARRYGDCKDKATLLVAWLRAAGIPASLALLAAGYDQDVPETLPGMASSTTRSCTCLAVPRCGSIQRSNARGRASCP